ncbi:MAG: universal stress protein [Candidatus Melainabacteria bacterium]|nr:universal stress protein [Candidatus Melainabacteria bacterium]
MRVLAAIDGSPHSQSVIDAVGKRVWDAGTVIKLLLVVEEHADPYRTKGGYHRIEYAPAVESPSKPHQNLMHFTELLRQSLGQQNVSVFIDPEIIIGDAKNTILTLAQDWRAELLVLGTQRRGLEKLFLGSVSKHVLDHTTSNVLIARSAHTRITNEGFRVLVAIDHSSYSMAAVDWLVQQRWKETIEIQLITVLSERSQISDVDAKQNTVTHASEKSYSLELLESWAAEIGRKTNATSVCCCVMDGDPKEIILSASQSWRADLILMGSHGRTGLNRLLLGSVSSSVSQNAQSSVEVIKSPKLLKL